VTKAEREEAAKIAQSLQAEPRQNVKVQTSDSATISKPAQNSLKSRMIGKHRFDQITQHPGLRSSKDADFRSIAQI
jgi:hypothetical protein